ncbi:MAG: FAD-dependent thymidylate synthase [Nanoarchaeota archaeon]|nr:FAD-dependent thymidylate synthase [Nanoarchaeota archaeon]MBU1104254.1 FAD-dependent thymidylate synthase [Nanoarchaeota archaeon]
MSFEKKVKLWAWLQNPQEMVDADDIAACGARSCRSEFCSAEIHKSEVRREDYLKRKETIFRESSGRGHGAVEDQSAFVFSIDNLTRASTLVLCGPQYASHDQQSLRVATAERGFHLPDGLDGEARKIMEAQFGLYEIMQSAGVPGEDARFILPLYTKTAIQSLWSARELKHLDFMARRGGVLSEVKDTVEQMVEQARSAAPKLMENRGANYEVLSWMPSSQLFARNNLTLSELIGDVGDGSGPVLLSSSKIPMGEEQIRRAVEERDEAELANLKHFHFTYLAHLSLASFHQATRQRSWDQSVEPLRAAVEHSRIYVVPRSVEEKGFGSEFRKLSSRAVGYVAQRLDEPEAYGVLPHSLSVYDLIHINGWNAIHAIGKRTCKMAQWEIRDISQRMAEGIRRVLPELGKYAVPQGKIYGKCPERVPCGECFKKD